MRLAPLVLVILAAAACGKGSSSPSATKTDTGSDAGPSTATATAPPSKPKPKRAPATPVCKAARDRLGPDAACVETELPELATAAGKLIRVHDATDPIRAYAYALVRPSGEIVIGSGSGQSSGGIIDDITRGLDLAQTPAETLARLYAALYIESAVVRCLPGAGDQLPEGKPCREPAIVEEGGKTLLTAIFEEHPDPRLLNRDDHWIMDRKIQIENGTLSSEEGEGVARLDPAAPRPETFPPVPAMTTAPDWVAPPVKAPADLSAALCAEAVARISGFEGQRCEAHGYPALDLPTGSIYYLANDAGQRYAFGLRKPDGTIVAGYDVGTTENPLVPIVASYDPTVMPPEKFLAAYLLLHGIPARIRCLPGANDALPEKTPCVAPTATRKGDELVIEAIIEQLAIPDEHGSRADPAIREIRWAFTPGGGMSGDGHRLVDLREPDE